MKQERTLLTKERDGFQALVSSLNQRLANLEDRAGKLPCLISKQRSRIALAERELKLLELKIKREQILTELHRASQECNKAKKGQSQCT